MNIKLDTVHRINTSTGPILTYPTNTELDRICPDIWTIIVNYCGVTTRYAIGKENEVYPGYQKAEVSDGFFKNFVTDYYKDLVLVLCDTSGGNPLCVDKNSVLKYRGCTIYNRRGCKKFDKPELMIYNDGYIPFNMQDGIDNLSVRDKDVDYYGINSLWIYQLS